MTRRKQESLEELYGEIQQDADYRSETMGEIFVPGRGNPEGSPVVFIGEAPGRQEEKERSPFVGAAGKNLNALLKGISLPRANVFITNLVKYRPLNEKGDNRSPTTSESRYALPYLLRELEILTPRVVVCLGLSAAKALLEDPQLKMNDANAEFFEKNGLKVLVTYHPSPFNYRFPGKRQAMEEAFQRLKEVL